jgi:hypothetical protein
MRSVTPDEARHIPAQPHRPGGIAFRHLLAGDEDRPDNYSLTVVTVAERYHAPRHRHNFEQVRVMLAGRFGFGPGLVQEPGSVGYFCEGTPYTQDGDGPSTTLLLQVGGATGSGYLGFDRLQAGIRRLQERGSFHDGVFTWTDAEGKKHNADGYEAVWEHEQGRPIAYPRPRYLAPVILEPERFGWLPEPGQPGLAQRALGSFNERGLALAQWRLDPGAGCTLPAAPQRQLAYVLAGAVELPQRRLPEGSAFELLPGEGLRLAAGEAGVVLMAYRLPRFD